VHSIAGDMVSAPYLYAEGYDLHVYPSLIRRGYAEGNDGAHWLQAFAALRVVDAAEGVPSFAFTRSSPPEGKPLGSTSVGIADAISVLADYEALARSAAIAGGPLDDAALASAYLKTGDSGNDEADGIASELAKTRDAQPGAFSHHVIGVLV
jgi:hypothetical protein